MTRPTFVDALEELALLFEPWQEQVDLLSSSLGRRFGDERDGPLLCAAHGGGPPIIRAWGEMGEKKGKSERKNANKMIIECDK